MLSAINVAFFGFFVFCFLFCCHQSVWRGELPVLPRSWRKRQCCWQIILQWVLHDPAPISDVILENPGSSFELAVHLTEAAQIHLKSMFRSQKLQTHAALWFWKIKLIIGT